MKRIAPFTIALALSTMAFTQTSTLRAQEVEPGFKSLFNGKDLTGWAGRPQHWSVQDGAITGITTKETPAQGNNFLIAKDGDQNLVVSDFELRLSFKFSSDWGNSGVQYRSEALPNFVVHGYQADMETGTTYTGILYEEGGRGILCERGKKVVIKADSADPNKTKIETTGSVGDAKAIQATIKNGEWNDYVVIAQGNHLQHFVNGKQTADVTDEQAAKAAKSGILALQLHAGQPMKIQFKNIRIKKLSGPSAGGSDLERMQGDWVPVEITANGEKLGADFVANLKLHIKGNNYTVETSNGEDQGSFKLKDGATPKAIDVSTQGGDELPAIYEFSGDTMRVCYGINGADRPKDFTSTEGSSRVMTTYKRKAP